MIDSDSPLRLEANGKALVEHGFTRREKGIGAGSIGVVSTKRAPIELSQIEGHVSL